MKNIACLIILLSLCQSVFAQDQKTNELIQNSLVKLFDGVARLDDDFMRAQVTDDFTLIEDTKVWTIDSLINVLKPLRKSEYKRINTLVFRETEYQGDMAWVFYENKADISTNSNQRTVRWLESAVIVRQRGEWKIKLLHSTRLK